MAWTPQSFKDKHNHSLNQPQAKKAASMADAILRSGAPEGIAIATANKYADKHPSGKTNGR